MDQESDQSATGAPGPLTKRERRVLGVLIEKSLTTPEYYPLSLKALTTGCNQKNNRSPLSSYDEYEVEETLDQLRSRGWIASVQTAGGRTERYRHLLRDAVGWGNLPLAIMGELLLRGRQQIGELRSRANRMLTTKTIEDLDELRSELHKLMDTGYVQASGDLQRRGVEVDHTLYKPEEGKTLAQDDTLEVAALTPAPASSGGVNTGKKTEHWTPSTPIEADAVRQAIAPEPLPHQDEDWRRKIKEELRQEVQGEVEKMQQMIEGLDQRLRSLEQQLGL